MNFDVYKIPSSKSPVFTSRYMEAMVKEEFRLLNSICENYSMGYLTESAALSMLNILNNDEYSLMETAIEAADVLDNRSLEEAIGIDTIPYAIGFFGESINTFKEIIKASEGKSIYKEYTLDRFFGSDTVVSKEATKIADRLEAELKIYKESEGKEGFTEYERNLYATYPDDRVDRNFLYERAIDANVLSGAVALEDACILKHFVNTRYMAEEVADLSPVVPLTGEDLGIDLSNVNTKDMVASTNSEASMVEDTENGTDSNNATVMYATITNESTREELTHTLRSAGAFLALEGVIYKNNMVFDTEVRKIFDKLQKDLRMAVENNPTESFKKNLNIKKNRYTFSFANQAVEPSTVTSAIASCGYKPVKENGTILNYVKTAGDIKITVEFTSVENGIVAFYEAAKGEVVKESTLEEKLDFAKKCDASDVRDAAKKVTKLQNNKDASSEDMKEAINNLDHAIENYNEVKKEKEKAKEPVKESVESLSTRWSELVSTREIISNWNREVKSYEEHVEDKTNFKRNIMDFMNRSFTCESVGNRMGILIDSLNTSMGYVNEYNFPEVATRIVTEAPSNRVLTAVSDVMESVMDEEVESAVLEEKANALAESYKRQCEEESICETVLNNSEFAEMYLTEADKHDIDEDIRATLTLLERNGYKVKYSCSGHHKSRIKEDNYKDGVYHGKLYTTARITFDGKYEFKTLPDGWYENKNADVTSIYVRPMTYDPKDGTPNEAFDKWKSSYMNALKNWADHLGESKDTSEEAKTESVLSGLESYFMQIPEEIALVESVAPPAPDFDSFMEGMMSDMF